MKTFKNLLRIIFFIIYPNYLLSEIITKDDLKFLSFKDKKIFVENCLEKENILVTPRCLNFLGLKILLNNSDKVEISKESLKYIERQAIYYLKEAAERGFIDAYINLGWLYSNNNFELQDLKKSAEYFKLYNNLKTKVAKIKVVKNDKMILDRDQIISAILIIQKLDLYKKYNVDQENYYLTEREYEKGKRVFQEIIDTSYLPESDIENLKKEVKKKNKLNFNELQSNLAVFEKKYRRTAIKELNKLQGILN
tara:strand:- start:563 stop:1318 length:756 start_codon:yes stop_codon:yes gene_type:complete